MNYLSMKSLKWRALDINAIEHICLFGGKTIYDDLVLPSTKLIWPLNFSFKKTKVKLVFVV
jgi:hypothetical protein